METKRIEDINKSEFIGGTIVNLDELRNDCALKQKKGLHIILASVVMLLTILPDL